jgi:hypothetical protein
MSSQICSQWQDLAKRLKMLWQGAPGFDARGKCLELVHQDGDRSRTDEPVKTSDGIVSSSIAGDRPFIGGLLGLHGVAPTARGDEICANARPASVARDVVVALDVLVIERRTTVEAVSHSNLGWAVERTFQRRRGRAHCKPKPRSMNKQWERKTEMEQR